MIEIFLDAKATPKNGSAFAVILKNGDTIWKRSLNNGINTLNHALLNATKYGILSVSSQHQEIPIQINTRNKFLIELFELDNSDVYRIVPKSNIELITEVRDLVSSRPIKFSMDSSDLIDECKDMATDVVGGNKLIFIKT